MNDFDNVFADFLAAYNMLNASLADPCQSCFGAGGVTYEGGICVDCIGTGQNPEELWGTPQLLGPPTFDGTDRMRSGRPTPSTTRWSRPQAFVPDCAVSAT
jgi:hypothetical protein